MLTPKQQSALAHALHKVASDLRNGHFEEFAEYREALAAAEDRALAEAAEWERRYGEREERLVA
jgi:hypothetical protein